MANVRSRLSVTESLQEGYPYLRSVLTVGEVVLGGIPALRSRLLIAESAYGGVPSLRSRLLIAESAYGAAPHLRSRLVVVETLMQVLEERVSTDVFPTLIGLSFDVQKKPIFSNKIALHTSGKETATAYYANPKWEFTLTYDYLPDQPKDVGETDLRTIMGFFLSRQGRWDTFLYQDPDDYVVTKDFQADFDGVTVDFKLVRSIGGFYEPIGYLNSTPTLAVWLNLTETSDIPDTPGPYTITVAHAGAYVETESVTINGAAAVAVPSAPAAGQYSVAAGVYTFNVADKTKEAAIRYQYLVAPADYTVVLPNVVQFDTAPPDEATAYASFHYYSVCRFVEDIADFTKFMEKLWSLSEIGLRSVPQ